MITQNTAQSTYLRQQSLRESVLALRTNLRWSQVRLARELLVTNQSVHRYENGARPEPLTLRRLGAIALRHGYHDLFDVFMSVLEYELELPDATLQTALRGIAA